ncbi:MAG TPA: hypothetical protein DD400_03365 [Rhodospirillaceae bacterium]|nr:hypothetical protein [Rhodospirillaceae bacterium]
MTEKVKKKQKPVTARRLLSRRGSPVLPFFCHPAQPKRKRRRDAGSRVTKNYLGFLPLWIPAFAGMTEIILISGDGFRIKSGMTYFLFKEYFFLRGGF